MGPNPRTPEQRRQDIRNYGVSLVFCMVGVGLGLLIRRSGWGGSFGTIMAFLSAVLALFCLGSLLVSLKK